MHWIGDGIRRSPYGVSRIGSVFLLMLMAIMGGVLLSDHPLATPGDAQLALYLPLDGETDEHAISPAENEMQAVMVDFPSSPFVPGVVSNALIFSSNAYLQVRGPTLQNLTNGFSLSFFFLGNRATPAAVLAQGNDLSANRWTFQATADGAVEFQFKDVSSEVQEMVATTNALIGDNLWHHLTAVYHPPSGAALYVDGEVQAAGTIANWNFITTDSIMLGSSSNSSLGSGFLLDDVHLYQAALSSNMVRRLFEEQVRASTLTAGGGLGSFTQDSPAAPSLTGLSSNWFKAYGYTLAQPSSGSSIETQVLAAPSGPSEREVMTFRAYIDGSDSVHIQSNTVWYVHQNYELPGKWPGTNNFPTIINGNDWLPNWATAPVSSKYEGLVPSLPSSGAEADIDFMLDSFSNDNPARGVGTVGVTQAPGLGNNYEAVVLIDDDAPGGPDWYNFAVSWNPVPKVDLDIHNGQDGPEIAEDNEETVGAFTGANLNDTDGDGTLDKDDNEVKATTNGRDEIDLMKLIIRKPDPDAGGKVKLKVIASSVKLWEKATKETAVTLSGGAVEFDTTDLPKTLWVEATAISGAIRDIELELDYKGSKDKVKATGVGAEQTGFINTGTDLFADTDGTAIQESITSAGIPFGATAVSPITANGMLMEFKVKPDGVGSEPGIVFDIVRQKENKAWLIDGKTVTEVIQKEPSVFPDTFPTKDEEPNDDTVPTDEDNDPKNNHIYSEDFVGFRSDIAFADRAVSRFNFNEFVRVLVNGGAFANQNGAIEGSRCSSKIPWRSRMDVVEDKKTGRWERNTGVEGENEIELGHKAIGDPPTPKDKKDKKDKKP